MRNNILFEFEFVTLTLNCIAQQSSENVYYFSIFVVNVKIIIYYFIIEIIQNIQKNK